MTLKYKVGDVLNSTIKVPGGREERSKKMSYNAQDTFLNQLRKDKVEVELQFLSGEKIKGRIVGFDNFSIIIENEGQQLIYKHSVSTVTPLGKKTSGDSKGQA